MAGASVTTQRVQHTGPAAHTAVPHAPTLEEVAEVAGVSRSTASRAINGGYKVSAKAQAAVDNAIAQLGYSPNRAARTLVTRRTDSIALVVPEPDERVLSDPFFAATIKGLSQVLQDTDKQLVMVMTRVGERASSPAARYLRNRLVDGAIVVSHHREDELDRVLVVSRLPCVFIGRPWAAQEPVQYVDVNNYLGARRATEYLIARGCRRVATIAGPLDMAAGVDRLSGWRQAMVDAGLPADAVACGDFTTAGGTSSMEQLLAEHPDIDGLFAASDLMASGALDVLVSRGIRVPQDIKLMGFDGLGVDTSTTPRLSTMRNPVLEMTVKAGELLLEQISAGSAPAEPVIFNAELIVRAST